ncbi:TM2 domain-containing protein [Haloferula sp. A504]|uniref:TM2 domain-containing protein n=1 Tax=Haloferula sp. A504 TaxID=3373601 RepID=UPI0031C4C2FF|nr:TM2 domain-containing protein [Verrucomicrobiaceae bacterium E54]
MSNEPENPKPESEDSPPPAPEPAPAPETPPAAETPPAPQPAPAGGGGSDKKVIAGVLGILLGWIGIHKFYLGYQKEGIIMLVVGLVGYFLCAIPTAIVGVIGLIEGILYLTKSDDEFEKTYITGQKPWF